MNLNRFELGTILTALGEQRDTLIALIKEWDTAPPEPGQEEMLAGFHEVQKHRLVEVDRLLAKVHAEYKAGRRKK
jgi:hypothetical protein